MQSWGTLDQVAELCIIRWYPVNTSFSSHLLCSFGMTYLYAILFSFFLSLFFFCYAPTLMSFWKQFYHRRLGWFGWRFGQLWCVCLVFFYNIHRCNHKDYKDFIFGGPKNSGSWWWTGRPGVLPSMESQRVGHDWATELNWNHCRWWLQSWN